ncbi:hypothetical protein EDD86DRAFT_201119 [Gorgonomyces haynaldii]|nr:hypothetical protein EDD86DRAFT_201080 [Gorgonomyces haynaldii]KAI8913643.1 hypothetical protein EDD86DRAFT_201119 [Gorgonomyces haynaldii]
MCFLKTDKQVSPTDQFDQWLELLKPTDTLFATEAPVELFPDLDTMPEITSFDIPQTMNEQLMTPETLSPSTVSSPIMSQSVEKTQRKRKQEDVSPELLLKRQRNNEAARKSRERRLQKIDDLSHQVGELTAQNTQLTMKMAVLEAERTLMLEREKNLHKRILELENQLGESHKALLAVGQL